MFPDFKRFLALSRKHGLVPLWMEAPADLDTPLTVYLKLARGKDYSLLLESVEGSQRFARYSFISASHHTRFESRRNRIFVQEADAKVQVQSGDALTVLRDMLAQLNPAQVPELPDFCGGAVGMAAYDIVRNFERLPSSIPDDLSLPDSLFLLTKQCVLFDHWKHKMVLVQWNKIDSKKPQAVKKIYLQAIADLKHLANFIQNQEIRLPAKKRLPKALQAPIEKLVRSNFTHKQFCERVQKIKEYIRAGDVIQTVISQRFELPQIVDSIAAYRALRRVNPSPYLYHAKLGNFTLVGSSPEILVRKEGQEAIVRPIAGTRKRGNTPEQDLALEKELLADIKERAEHVMLVDLGRNDLGRCCQPGTVQVSDYMHVDRYSHVMHLVSDVQGQLAKGQDAFSLFRACFPAGTVSGAAKIRSMEIIEELEAQRRGTYAGSVGYFSYAGNMDMAITIRTMLFKKGKIFIQAGAGIVADSVPEFEERETRSKAAALFKALELAREI